MAYDFTELKKGIDGINEWLAKEFSAIRTGRATATLLDGIMIDVYGTRSPISQNATISVEDPRTLRIVPWDKAVIAEIDKEITKADLGVSTSRDSDGMRVIFPNLTTENRERLVKQAKSKAEEAKVSLRQERAKIVDDIDEGKKNGEIPEDDAKRYKDEMQKMIDSASKGFDELVIKKEQEVMS